MTLLSRNQVISYPTTETVAAGDLADKGEISYYLPNPTPWGVAWFWKERQEALGIQLRWSIRSQLRPAAALLNTIGLEQVCETIEEYARFCAPKGRCFTLFAVAKKHQVDTKKHRPDEYSQVHNWFELDE